MMPFHCYSLLLLDISSCVAFNPVYPVMASCSGQRKFQLPGKSKQNDESDSDGTDESDDTDNDDNDDNDEITIDNTLKAWRVPGQYQWFGLDDQSGTVNNEETTAQ
jgi:hypothetical protein